MLPRLHNCLNKTNKADGARFLSELSEATNEQMALETQTQSRQGSKIGGRGT